MRLPITIITLSLQNNDGNQRYFFCSAYRHKWLHFCTTMCLGGEWRKMFPLYLVWFAFTLHFWVQTNDDHTTWKEIQRTNRSQKAKILYFSREIESYYLVIKCVRVTIFALLHFCMFLLIMFFFFMIFSSHNLYRHVDSDQHCLLLVPPWRCPYRGKMLT